MVRIFYKFWVYTIALLVSGISAAQNPEIFTHLGDAEDLKARNTYEVSVLNLALEKTREKYGDFILLPATSDLTQMRALENMRDQRYPNYVRTFGYDEQLGSDKHLTFVEFPVYLGILSYRTCFTSELIADEVDQIQSEEELRNYIFGFGVGWMDGKVFSYHNFKTMNVSRYQSLFKMTALNRVNLFCRGSNEILNEYNRYIGLKGLTYNRALAIHYPLPHFFFTNKEHKRAAERIAEGLKLAWKDGSLITLWEEEFGESVRFANISSRRLFKLGNPFVDDVVGKYEKYLIEP